VSRPPARHQKPRSKAARVDPPAGPDRQDRATQQDRQDRAARQDRQDRAARQDRPARPDRSASSGWFPAPTASATLTASGALALSAAPAVLTRPTRPARPAKPANHRKPPAQRKRSSALRDKRIVAAVAGSTLLVSAAAASPTVLHWSETALHPAAANQAPALNDLRANSQAGQDATGGLINTAGNASNQWAQIPTAQVTAARLAAAQRVAARRAAAARAAAAQRRAEQAQQAQAAATAAAYANPLRNVSALVPERVDQGVDFSGSGPVYAIGNGVVTEAEGSGSGWPGGGWITYRLTSGPAQGLVVYVAEDVTPDVQVGQTVTASTVLATMFNGSDGIETGWAEGDGSSEEPESQAPEAGGIGAGGPFPTIVGLNFDELLQALGVPAAPNAGEAGSGALPQGYPANWSAAVKP
jgi:murein DD-endopeptidase MepM/ murein hydrolase activator NlpD